MAKYRRRRYRRRSGKWAPNINELTNVSIPTQTGNWSGTALLTTNPAQSNLIVSQTYTVKNFDINFTIESAAYTQIEAVTAYIMFVPQGMNVGEDYNLAHPEYIMNFKYLGSPSAGGQTSSSTTENQQYQPFRIRTRLSRKLQTGDSVILFIKGFSTTTATPAPTVEISGLIRWWTKAN